MILSINSEPRDFRPGISLAELLADLAVQSTRGLAVAVDDQVVPRDQWATRRLAEGNRITIIRATQGG